MAFSLYWLLLIAAVVVIVAVYVALKTVAKRRYNRWLIEKEHQQEYRAESFPEGPITRP